MSSLLLLGSHLASESEHETTNVNVGNQYFDDDTVNEMNVSICTFDVSLDNSGRDAIV